MTRQQAYYLLTAAGIVLHESNLSDIKPGGEIGRLYYFPLDELLCLVESELGIKTDPKAVDFVAADELILFADNDSETYFKKYMPIVSSLDRKVKRKVFDSEKAIAAFLYVADYAAKRYVNEFGGIWYQVFDKNTRRFAAACMLADYIQEQANDIF